MLDSSVASRERSDLHLVLQALGDLLDLRLLAVLQRLQLGLQIEHLRMPLAVLARQLRPLAIELELARPQLGQHRRIQQLRRLVQIDAGAEQPLDLAQLRLGLSAVAARDDQLGGQPR